MSYLGRLEDQFPEKCPTDVLTKPTEGGFVSSVSIRVGQNKPVEALRVSVGIPHKPDILAALAHSDDVALWWSVVILEPGGRTLEFDTPSGLDPRRLASLRRVLPRPWVRCDRRSRRSRDPRRVRADLR